MFVPPRNRGAFDPREPFSRAEAQAAGLTAETLLSKRFHKIFWDHHPAVGQWTSGTAGRPLALSQSARANHPPQGLADLDSRADLLGLAGIGVGLVDLVVLADGMIKERHTSPERLIEAAAQWSGKGCRWLGMPIGLVTLA
jgi:hypothetical protein